MRVTAAFAAALIMALSVFAASPALHSWLHGDTAVNGAHSEGQGSGPHDRAGSDSADDGCAVSLFAQGVLGGSGLLIVFFFTGRFEILARSLVERLGVRAVRYWLPPLCGPPALT